jgi:hypothetical protein
MTNEDHKTRKDENHFIYRTFVGLEVLTAAVKKSSIFCDITSYNSFEVNRRFGEYVASIFRAEK